MGRNAYAAKIVAAKRAVAEEERKAIIERCLTTMYRASAVALNNRHKFGPKMIADFRDELEAVIAEYGGLMDGTDVEYADEKLEQRYKQIMREE